MYKEAKFFLKNLISIFHLNAVHGLRQVPGLPFCTQVIFHAFLSAEISQNSFIQFGSRSGLTFYVSVPVWSKPGDWFRR